MNPQKQIHKNKILWLFPTTKDKEIKLFTTKRNQSFFYYIVVWKTNALSTTSHRMYSKNRPYSLNLSVKSTRFIPSRNPYVSYYGNLDKELQPTSFFLSNKKIQYSDILHEK